MLTDCGNVPWTNLNKAKLNNGYIHLPSSNNTATTETTSIMDYESSSDAALLDQQEQQLQQPQHSNIISNPVNSSNLASPQHVPPMSLRNSISSSTSPTNKSQSVVVVSLGNPNSMQTITTLQRNNVKNSSTRSIRSSSNVPIGNNNIKPSDNINIFKAHNNSRKYKFNLLKLSTSSSSSGASRSTRNRLLIFAICLIIFGIAIGALTVHLSGIYHCNPDRIGT